MSDVVVTEKHICQHCTYDTIDEAEMCIHLEKEHNVPQSQVEVVYE